MHEAAFGNCPDVAELLIRSGAGVNTKDNVCTALIIVYVISPLSC